jgi:hypothetical protein
LAHAYNPSYSGRSNCDQEDHSSKPTWANNEILSGKTLHEKLGWWQAQGEGPEFKPQYHKKKKKVHIL